MHRILPSLPIFLPTVQAWAEKQEALILAEGELLTESQLTDARRAGVAHPEKIRFLRVEALPELENDDLMFLARQIGFYNARSSGLSLGYGICLTRDFWDDRYALVHECVHTGQYEKRNGIGPFLSEYLRECIEPGYPFGHMEQEAIRVARDICKSAVPPKQMGQASS